MSNERTDTAEESERQRRMGHMVVEIGPRESVDRIAKSISHIDVSRIARAHGDIGSAESALDCAREILAQVLGIA